MLSSLFAVLYRHKLISHIHTFRVRSVLVVARIAVADHENEQYYATYDREQTPQDVPTRTVSVVKTAHRNSQRRDKSRQSIKEIEYIPEESTACSS